MANSMQSSSDGTTATTTCHLLTHEMNNLGDFSLLDEVNKKFRSLEELRDEVGLAMNELRRSTNQQIAIDQQIEEKWLQLRRSSENRDQNTVDGSQQAATIRVACRKLLIRLGEARKIIDITGKQLQQIEASKLGERQQHQQQQRRKSSNASILGQPTSHCRASSGQLNNSKRLSSIIRELCDQFDETQNKRRDSNVDSGREAERMRKQLAHYDAEMALLLESLRSEQTTFDEKFLRRPDIHEIFKQLETLLPMVPFEPIRIPLVVHHDQTDQLREVDIARPSIMDLQDILQKHLVSDSDDGRRVIDQSKRYFQ